ncbi:zinc finger protein 665-like [Anopheles coustani]|uniref:zinc finger protein 665-like n=1 Tax=Anopheles coustani TaxID=139045 RepID=UPI00265AB11D|nr:zinc finger protein 665-like [Anopheles coustani]
MAEDLSINKNKILTQRYGNSNNDICRLCLKNEPHMEPLFYTNLFPNILLTKKIYDCTSIQIIYDRNLPMFVCKLCANKLDEYVRFRERCVANDEFLRNALAAFDMGNGAGNCSGIIKKDPDGSPPPPTKLAQCLGVTPIELNRALVAAAAAATDHQTAKREPLDLEDDDGSQNGRMYEHGSQTSSPDRSSDLVGDFTHGKMHDAIFRSANLVGIPSGISEPQHESPPYVCEICSKSFKIRHHLLVHRHTHVDSHNELPISMLNGGVGGGVSGGDGGGATGTGKQSYSCPKCTKVFVNKGNLLNHLETHTNEKNYACEICSKTFKYNVQLRLHMRIHTGERPHKCEICNRGFSQLSNLRSHRKTHSKVKPYKCHLCLKSFTVLDNLTAHSAKCLKDKFRCSLCSKSFAKEGNLLTHLQSHSEGVVEKMFKCEMCPKSFKNKEDWKRHVRVHTGEKPYTCDICSKGFAQKANLLSHQKTHLKPNVIFKCDRCDRTFRTQKVLEMHFPKCGVVGAGLAVSSSPVTPRSESTPVGSPSPVTTGTPATTATTPTLSEALSDLLRYEIALRAPLELQQMLLGHMDRKKPNVTGSGGKPTGRRYRCDVCFKGYSQYPSLIKHRKLHFKVPPLVKVLGAKAKNPPDHNDSVTCDDGEEMQAQAVGPLVSAPDLACDPERPYGCDICGGRFEAPSAHPPDRCREDLQLRVLLEPVPLERGPEAPPAVAHRRAAFPVHTLPEGIHAAVQPAGPHEDSRTTAADRMQGPPAGRSTLPGTDAGSGMEAGIVSPGMPAEPAREPQRCVM